MRRTITRSIIVALASLGLFASGCGEKGGAATGGAPEAKASSAPADSGAVVATAPVTAVAPPTATAVAVVPSAMPSATATVAAAMPSGAPSAAPAASGSGSAVAGPKTFDCGAKGQKPCPMQGWMKGVMAGASSSGDGEKLASALSYVAGRTPPGFGGWSAIASAGATKAKAGDIDGAKASCKQCHDQFKEKYKTTMRDRPF